MDDGLRRKKYVAVKYMKNSIADANRAEWLLNADVDRNSWTQKKTPK